MSSITLPLGDLYARRTESVNPARHADEAFELFSVPSYEGRMPDLVTGAEIGSTKVSVLPGDVLLCKIVPHIRRAWVVPPRGSIRQIGSGEWIVMRDERFHSDYLRHLVLSDSFHAFFMSTVAGVGGSLMRARPSHASTIPIRLPSLPEQRRIAAILDQADELRTKGRHALTLLDELAASLFIDMFGDPTVEKNRHPWMRVDEIATTRLGKMLDAKQRTGKHLKPYLRNANVHWMRFELDSMEEMDFPPDMRHEYRLRPGDILMCEGGRPGRSAIWAGEIEECYFQKALHRIRTHESLMLPEVFVWTMKFMSDGGALDDSVTSATIAHLTGEKLKSLKLPVPSMRLQRDFVQKSLAVQEMQMTMRASLSVADEFFASLQHRAFRGEL